MNVAAAAGFQDCCVVSSFHHLYHLYITHKQHTAHTVQKQTRTQLHIAQKLLKRQDVVHYTRTVSEWTKDNPVSFGLRDMTIYIGAFVTV